MAAIDENVRVIQVNEGGILRFVRWESNYVNGESKCFVQCCTCEHTWKVRVRTAAAKDNGCPKCKGVYRYTQEEYEQRVNEREGFKFVNWPQGFKNATSRVKVECDCGHQWEPTLNCFLHLKSGCPKCHPRHNMKPEDYERKIDDIDNVNFISWDGVFRGKRTRCNLMCDKGHQWNTFVGHVTGSQSSRCPACAKHGYDISKPGYLYALVSECGSFIKVGIANKLTQRLKQLERYTPFKFEKLYSLKMRDGRQVREIEQTIHSEFESAKFEGFTGCTEWMVRTPALDHRLKLVFSNAK